MQIIQEAQRIFHKMRMKTRMQCVYLSFILKMQHLRIHIHLRLCEKFAAPTVYYNLTVIIKTVQMYVSALVCVYA